MGGELRGGGEGACSEVGPQTESCERGDGRCTSNLGQLALLYKSRRYNVELDTHLHRLDSIISLIRRLDRDPLDFMAIPLDD